MQSWPLYHSLIFSCLAISFCRGSQRWKYRRRWKSGWVKDKDRTAFRLWISRNSRKTQQYNLQQRWPAGLRHWRLHRMRSPQKTSGKVPRQSCWRWPEKRLDPSSRKRKRNGYLMRLTQQSGKREKQKAKTRNDIKNWRQRYEESSEWINSSSRKACAWN